MKDTQDITVHISIESLIKAILVIVLFGVLFILKDLVLVVLTAVIVAASMEPMTRWFIARKIPRVPAVLGLYLGLGFFLITLFYFLVLPLFNDVSQLISSSTTQNSIVELFAKIEESFIGSQPVVKDLQNNLTIEDLLGGFGSSFSKTGGGVISTVSAIFGGLVSFFLILILSFYLSVQENGIRKFLYMVTPYKHREYALDLWKRSERKIGLWFQGQLVLVVVIGVLTYLGLLLLGVKHALLLAVIAGLFELIPLFGPLIAAIPAVAVALLDGGAVLGVLVGGFYLIIQQFENQLIYPLVVRKVVGVPPIIVILALVAGGVLAGFIGILLSVPLAAILLEFIKDYQLEHMEDEE